MLYDSVRVVFVFDIDFDLVDVFDCVDLIVVGGLTHVYSFSWFSICKVAADVVNKDYFDFIL